MLLIKRYTSLRLCYLKFCPSFALYGRENDKYGQNVQGRIIVNVTTIVDVSFFFNHSYNTEQMQRQLTSCSVFLKLITNLMQN